MVNMKVDIDAKKIMSEINIEINVEKFEKDCFGAFKWRKHLAMFLFWAGSKVLRVNYEIN